MVPSDQEKPRLESRCVLNVLDLGIPSHGGLVQGLVHSWQENDMGNRRLDRLVPPAARSEHCPVCLGSSLEVLETQNSLSLTNGSQRRKDHEGERGIE